MVLPDVGAKMATMGMFVPAARADEVQAEMYGAVPDTGCAVHPVMAIPFAVKPHGPGWNVGRERLPRLRGKCGGERHRGIQRARAGRIVRHRHRRSQRRNSVRQGCGNCDVVVCVPGIIGRRGGDVIPAPQARSGTGRGVVCARRDQRLRGASGYGGAAGAEVNRARGSGGCKAFPACGARVAVNVTDWFTTEAPAGTAPTTTVGDCAFTVC